MTIKNEDENVKDSQHAYGSDSNDYSKAIKEVQEEAREDLDELTKPTEDKPTEE